MSYINPHRRPACHMTARELRPEKMALGREIRRRHGQQGPGAYEYRRQAKSQCRPSSREMSSLEKVRPCMRPRFLSQKMLQKLPLKKMPSTHAQATSRSAKLDSLKSICLYEGCC